METASFNGFIKTLFFIIVFWYLFKFLARIFLPILLKKAVHKASRNFQQQHSQPFRQNNSGEVHIDTSKAPRSKEKKKVGEYVDYEELD
ncbi:MAG: DUF4834 family protein [Flavobacterium sp.]|nr:DUF4834 family protein [Flavobacterium sp.]